MFFTNARKVTYIEENQRNKPIPKWFTALPNQVREIVQFAVNASKENSICLRKTRTSENTS